MKVFIHLLKMEYIYNVGLWICLCLCCCKYSIYLKKKIKPRNNILFVLQSLISIWWLKVTKNQM